MFRSLLWKEWREQRWKAAFGAVVLGAFAAIGLKTRILPDGGVIALSFLLSTLLFPVFIGIGLVPAEREERTLPYLLRIPARSWVPLGCKLLIGALVLLLPVLSVCLVYALFGWNREVESWMILYAGPICWGISLEILIWFLAFGMKRKRQDSAAIVSVLLLMAWLLIFVVFGALQTIEGWSWLKWIVAMLPLGYSMFTDIRFDIINPWMFAVLHGTVLILVCGWMFRQFTTARSERS